MSEDDTKKKKSTIKASIGAWWKSTTSVEEEASAPAEAKEKEEKKPPARRRSRTAAKKKTGETAGATRRSPAKTEGGDAAEATPVESAESGKDASAEGGTAKNGAAKGGAAKGGAAKGGSAKGRGRSSRSTAAGKKSTKGKEVTAALSDVEVEEHSDGASIAVIGADSNAGDDLFAGVADALEAAGESIFAVEESTDSPEENSGSAAAGEKREEPTRRGRRGRRGGRKSEAAKKEENSAEVQKSDEPRKSSDEPRKSLKLLINAEEPEECRLALLEGGRLESIHVSTIGREQRKSNIYKARVVAVEPSLQAAFIDYGTEKNGFLPFSEIHPEYFKTDLTDEVREKVEKQQWKKLSITDVVERGQELLAQVVKEEVGRKGANMTTFLSIPGRCVVLMPGSDSAGISRRISGEQRRGELREIMKGFDIPEGIGWIVRTASSEITENALTRDTDFLLKLWHDIRAKGQSMKGVGLLYEDHRTVSRFLREHFDPAIEEILVDDRAALEQVNEFLEMQPRNQRKVRVRLHQGARPIFNQYSVEDQIEQIYQPQVSLPSGGSIVIDPTEALVAIDVNSGSTSKGANFEESIFQANMEAAVELARQLRLRDLGGLVVVDFIDMRSRKHISAVEKQVKQAMKRDKAKVDFSKISKFGLMQISRQKLGAPIESGNYRVCEYCKGRGTIRSVETSSLFYLRRIQTGASRKPVERVECHLPMDVASYLLNHKRVELTDMEKRYEVSIEIIGHSRMKPNDNELLFHKKEKESRGGENKNRKK